MGATSIPCDEATRDRLKSLKGEESWNEFLAELADQYDGGSSRGELERRIDRLESRINDIESMATRKR